MSEEVIYPIEPVYTGTSRGTITITDPIDASAAAANKSQTGENLRIPFRFRNGNIHYPPDTQHLLYRTTNADYGRRPPIEKHYPVQYFGKPYAFQKEFLGGFNSTTQMSFTQTRSRFADLPPDNSFEEYYSDGRLYKAIGGGSNQGLFGGGLLGGGRIFFIEGADPFDIES
ncbi:MAG: hypothetical protein EZS28_023303 [Streblomastix strix]|uniref:Uncharacterized protein n=1 Tax=Streblomastix strix TaxID=222440 RepID=A0A5J4VFK2_9EUKA|nr:MAG: hypothetical protein EZS28_023303 [Streblomastix strix]